MLKQSCDGHESTVLASAMLSNLGILSFAKGQYNEAKKLHAEALRLRKEVGCTMQNGQRHVSERMEGLEALSAVVRKDAMCGRRGSSQQSLVARIERHERVDSAIADSMNNLAAVFELSGDYPTAMKLYKESMDLRIILFGTNSVVVAESMSNLGGVYDAMGLLEKALPLLENALQIYTNLIGTESTEVSLLLNNLGVLLCHLGNLQEAESTLERAVAIRRETYGPKHPLTCCCQQNLGTSKPHSGHPALLVKSPPTQASSSLSPHTIAYVRNREKDRAISHSHASDNHNGREKNHFGHNVALGSGDITADSASAARAATD